MSQSSQELTMTGTDVRIDEKIRIHVAEPKRWKVIILNDDATSIEFVVSMLMEVFNHTAETAADVTLKVHHEGSGIAGIYSFEIAEVKSVEATNLARQHGFPLQIKVEEE